MSGLDKPHSSRTPSTSSNKGSKTSIEPTDPENLSSALLNLKTERPSSPSTENQNCNGIRTPKLHTQCLVHFTIDAKGVKHVIEGEADESISRAMRKWQDNSGLMLTKKNKDIWLLGQDMIEGFVNLGMPLKCLPQEPEPHFTVNYFKVMGNQQDGQQGYRQYDSTGTECVIFYIKSCGRLGGNAGTQPRKILLCQNIVKSRANVCIFAPKGETIKEALCKDGRFLPILKEGQWKLVDDNNVVSLNNYSVDGIANKIYTVEFCNNVHNITTGPSRSKELATASPGQHDQASHSVKQLKLDPKLMEQKEWIKHFFEKEVEKLTTKQKEKATLKTVLELHRKQFSKTTKNSTPVRVHKLLVERSASVGYIEWKCGGIGSSGTCFVLHEGYILTCYHIFSKQLKQGFEKNWAELSQYVKINFSYEDQQIKDDWFFVEPRLEIVENTLDYVVLKLKKENAEFPGGLAQHYSPPPPVGLIYIIGHPDGKEKSTDGCSIITPLERGWRCTERLQEKYKEDCSPITCGPYHDSCIHIYTPRSFQEVVSNKNKVTYDTSFFFGSSGSPVFNASGQLIAMHAGGYVYNYHAQQRSVIEWGYSMEAIFKDLENKVPGWFESREFMRGSEDPTDGNEADVRKFPDDVIMESDSGSE